MVKSVRGLRTALNQGIVYAPVFALSLVLWLVLLASLSWLADLGQQAGFSLSELDNTHVQVFCFGLLCLPLASVAWAPLSLDAQRSQ